MMEYRGPHCVQVVNGYRYLLDSGEEISPAQLSQIAKSGESIKPGLSTDDDSRILKSVKAIGCVSEIFHSVINDLAGA